jgi:4-amino-4-deoxy-L-arabinose transferase-like glycosyltransferase
MSFLLWGIGLRVFGDTVAGLRMTSAILGTGAVLATVLLAQQVWSWRAAWFAGVASAFSHYAIHYSRLAYNNIGDPLIAGLVLWLLSRSLDRGRSALLQAASAGVLTGLGWYGYFGARLTGIIVTVFLLWRSIVEHAFLRRHRDRILIYVGCAVMAAAPLLLHYVDQPQALAERSRQVSLFRSGWLQQEQQASGRSTLSLLAAQVWKSVLGFHYTLDPTLIYHAEIPLLDAVSGVLVIIGLTWSFLTRQRRASSLLLTWLGLAVLFGWILTENPPSSQRLLIATPAVAILAGVGFDTLLHVVDAVAYSSRMVHVTLSVLFILSVALLNTVYYFVAYTPSRVYGNPTAEVTTELSRYLLFQDDDCIMYFHGPPFVYWEFGTLRFMVPHVEGINIFDVEPEDREAASHEGAQRARFFFLPERREDLNAVREKLPGGTESRFYSSADGRLLFLLYEVCNASSEE